jgi:hypothetical protein
MDAAHDSSASFTALHTKVKGDALVFDERGADEGVRPYETRLWNLTGYCLQPSNPGSVTRPLG